MSLFPPHLSCLPFRAPPIEHLPSPYPSSNATSSIFTFFFVCDPTVILTFTHISASSCPLPSHTTRLTLRSSAPNGSTPQPKHIWYANSSHGSLEGSECNCLDRVGHLEPKHVSELAGSKAGGTLCYVLRVTFVICSYSSRFPETCFRPRLPSIHGAVVREGSRRYPRLLRISQLSPSSYETHHLTMALAIRSMIQVLRSS